MRQNKDRGKRVAKNTLMLFFRMMLVMLVGLYTSRVILGVLGVEDFGIYNLVGSVIVLFSFLQQALNNATYRYLAYGIGEGNQEKLRKTFSMSLNVHLLLAIIIFALCETIGLWFLNNKLVIPEARVDAAMVVFHLSILSFCINIVKTPYNSVIIAHEQMSFYAYTSVVEVILKLLIVYCLLLFDADKLILYAFLLFGISILLFLWYYIRCRQLFSECHYESGWDSAMARDMTKYSGWSLVVNMADVCVNQSAAFFFNVFFGVVANAAMGIANQVNGHLTQFLSNFTSSYNPQIIKSYAAGDRDYFMKLLFSCSKFSFFLLFLVTIPVALNIDFILHIWLKNPPEGASTFVLMMILYSLVDAYSAPLWIGVHATGQLRMHQVIMASIKILNIPLAYLLLKFGHPAWAILLLKALLNFVCSIVRPVYVQKLYQLPLKDYFQNVFFKIYIVVVLVLPLPVYVSYYVGVDFLKLVLSVVAFYVISIPVIYYVGLNKNERLKIGGMVKSKLNYLKVNT